MTDKPSLADVRSQSFLGQVKLCLNRIMGRTGTPATPMTAMNSTALTIAPTAADYNKLRQDVDLLRTKYNALLSQVGDSNG